MSGGRRWVNSRCEPLPTAANSLVANLIGRTRERGRRLGQNPIARVKAIRGRGQLVHKCLWGNAKSASDSDSGLASEQGVVRSGGVVAHLLDQV